MVRGGTIPRIQFTVPMIILDEQLTIYKKNTKNLQQFISFFTIFLHRHKQTGLGFKIFL